VLVCRTCRTKTNCEIGLRADSPWHSKPAAERFTQRASEILDQPTALERLGTQSGEKVAERPEPKQTAMPADVPAHEGAGQADIEAA
jgi:hypothetical protein